MNDRRLNFWIMVLAGVPAFIWLVAELVRVSLEVWGRSGVWSLVSDGVVQHKVGELMVAVPLYLLFELGIVVASWLSPSGAKAITSSGS